MKRKITITIDIDTDRDQSFQTHAFATWEQRKDNGLPVSDSYKVKIGAGQSQDTDCLIATISHELGHILGTEFRTAGQIGDPRVCYNFANEGQDIIASEAEAWSFAARIFRATRADGLGSYERAYKGIAQNLEEV